MDYALIINTFYLFTYLSIPILLAALAGAGVAGVLRVATQIDDNVISFAGKLVAMALLFYLSASLFSSEIIGFTAAIWGRPEYYH